MLDTIHNSLVNGQRRQMVKQIDEYGAYDFFDAYHAYLADLYPDAASQYTYFADACISYHRAKAYDKDYGRRMNTYEVRIYDDNDNSTILDFWQFAANDYDEKHNTGPFNGLMKQVEREYPGADWSVVRMD